MNLRVLTLNLWGDHAPLARRLDAAARGIVALAPDAVLLQEVRVGEGLANTAAQLVERLGGAWEIAYACATRGVAGTWGAGTGAGEEGLAIVTRLPALAVVERREMELPDARPTSRRILLSARVEAGERGAVWLHTTHLHWRLSDGLARERQVAAIDAAVRAIDPEALHLVAGDFNAAPDTDEVRFLAGKHTLEGRRTHWQDAFARARPLEPGWTWARRNPQCTAELGWLDPDRRIDYVFVTTERRDGRGRVLRADLVLDAADEVGVYPSDHFGVLAEVAL